MHESITVKITQIKKMVFGGFLWRLYVRPARGVWVIFDFEISAMIF